MKFDVAFANDEERKVFAEAQRALLAKALGIAPELIEIGDVKPGSPITMIRFQIKGSDAAMIPATSRTLDGSGDRPASTAADRPGAQHLNHKHPDPKPNTSTIN